MPHHGGEQCRHAHAHGDDEERNDDQPGHPAVALGRWLRRIDGIAGRCMGMILRIHDTSHWMMMRSRRKLAASMRRFNESAGRGERRTGVGMSKRIRHKKILELVSSRPIQNQALLQELLELEGFSVTQSTLSRDIKELNLVKGADGYRTPGSLQLVPTGRPALQEALVRYLIKAVVAQNLVVLKTAPGDATPLAVALDHGDLAAILGTVAGDDTVLIVTADKDTAATLHHELAIMARGE
ncbi:MAG: hypothetical protein U1E76_02250 [Planctomycetota bacterium]